MKILEKIALIIYSNIMVILALAVCLITFGWLDYDLVSNIIKSIITNPNYTITILIINIVIVLLSIKCIFFDSSNTNNEKRGILLENSNGKLVISKETIENIVNSVAKEFEGAKDVVTKVEVDRESNLKIDVDLSITQDVIIKDLSINLQNKIKEAIKKSSDLEVKEVNVRVSNIASNKKQ